MKTEIIVITDRSGSMHSIADDVIGGYNAFIEEQKAVPGEAKVTFTQFDDKYDVVYSGKPLPEVPLLDRETYVPRGYTALLDAVGKTLTEQKARISKEAWAELVIVFIITDGHENCSREFKLADVKALTKETEAAGWKFIYAAANQDAFEAAHNIGLSGAAGQSYNATPEGTRAMYVASSDMTKGLRGAKRNV